MFNFFSDSHSEWGKVIDLYLLPSSSFKVSWEPKVLLYYLSRSPLDSNTAAGDYCPGASPWQSRGKHLHTILQLCLQGQVPLHYRGHFRQFAGGWDALPIHEKVIWRINIRLNYVDWGLHAPRLKTGLPLLWKGNVAVESWKDSTSVSLADLCSITSSYTREMTEGGKTAEFGIGLMARKCRILLDNTKQTFCK